MKFHFIKYRSFSRSNSVEVIEPAEVENVAENLNTAYASNLENKLQETSSSVEDVEGIVPLQGKLVNCTKLA